ncbi:MAG: hypothetical protein DRO09_02330 [Thermoprotei archaeon]|nr:MAG: hypothetical protein DRO09_02330 [Thermoprotei archaeon]
MNTNPCSLITASTATSIAAGLVLEALAEGKISTVSYLKGIKDLDMLKFALSSIGLQRVFAEMLSRVLKREHLDISSYILKGVKLSVNHPLISSNTSLGYLIISIPLTASIFRLWLDGLEPLNNVDGLRDYIYTCLRRSSVKNFYEAITISSPSYKGEFFGKAPSITDVENLGKFTLYDILSISRYWDLASYEVMEIFPYTFTVYAKLKEINDLSDLKRYLNKVSEEHVKLSSVTNDTTVARSRGISFAILVRESIRLADHAASDLDSWFRSMSVNLGSISDVIASAVSLDLMVRTLERFTDSIHL